MTCFPLFTLLLPRSRKDSLVIISISFLGCIYPAQTVTGVSGSDCSRRRFFFLSLLLRFRYLALFCSFWLGRRLFDVIGLFSQSFLNV